MPLTKQYLRYQHAATLGVVNGRKSNLLLTEVETGGKRRALVVAPAVEDVIVWDPRRGDKVSFLLLALYVEVYWSLVLLGCCFARHWKARSVCYMCEWKWQAVGSWLPRGNSQALGHELP